MSGSVAAFVLFVVAFCQPVLVEAQRAERQTGGQGGVAQEHDQSTPERDASQQTGGRGGVAQEHDQSTPERGASQQTGGQGGVAQEHDQSTPERGASQQTGGQGGVAQEQDQSTPERGASQQGRVGVQDGAAHGGAAQEDDMTIHQGTDASRGPGTTAQGKNDSHDALGGGARTANGTSSGCDEEKERNRTSYDDTQNKTRGGIEQEDRGHVAGLSPTSTMFSWRADVQTQTTSTTSMTTTSVTTTSHSLFTTRVTTMATTSKSSRTSTSTVSSTAASTNTISTGTVSSTTTVTITSNTQTSSTTTTLTTTTTTKTSATSAGPGDVSDESIVSGILVLSVSDPTSFSTDRVARLAVRNAVADLANVTHELVDLSLRTERRLSVSNSSTSGVNGSVVASYWIVVATSRIASNISDHIANMPLPDITTLCQRELSNSDLNVTVTVVSKASHVATDDTHGNRDYTRTDIQNHSSFPLGGDRLTVQRLNLTATGNLRGSSSVDDVVRSEVWMFPFAVCACAIGMALSCCGFRLHFRMKRLETQVIVIGEMHERPSSYRGDKKERVVAGVIMNGTDKVSNGAPVTPTWAWSP